MTTQSFDQMESAQTSSVVPKNLLCALTYLLGGLSGFLALHFKPYAEDREIRYHAWLSILFSGAWFIGSFFVNVFVGSLSYSIPGTEIGTASTGSIFLISTVHFAISLIGFLAWLRLMLAAYNRERFNLPVLSDMAARLADTYPGGVL